MREWLENYGLVQSDRMRARIARANYGWLAARCYPYASIERLQIIACYFGLYFLTDDLFVDRVETVSSQTIPNLTAIIALFDLDRLGSEPVYGEAAWVDLCQRMKPHMSAEHFWRFAHGMQMWAGAAGLQIIEHIHNQPIGLRQYETIRRHISGANPSLDLIDFANGNPLSPDEYHRPDVQQLRRHANNVISWSNDLHSLAMEISQPGQNKNMVAIYMAQGCSIQAGVDRTADRIRGEIQAFVNEATALRDHASTAILGYIEGLERWMAGYEAWVTNDTRRYARAFVGEDADDRDLVHT
ncbi:terpene synthase family protein [Dyella jejuensis]